jgi:hypothetical protein
MHACTLPSRYAHVAQANALQQLLHSLTDGRYCGQALQGGWCSPVIQGRCAALRQDWEWQVGNHIQSHHTRQAHGWWL